MKPKDYETFKKELFLQKKVRKEYDKLGELKCCICGADANLCKIIKGQIYCQKCIQKGSVK